MPDNSVSLLSGASQFRHAAVQRTLGLTTMASLLDEQGRPVPAKVYPASAEGREWVVEPPLPSNPVDGARRTFVGPAALTQALEYAHRTYGAASYYSR